MQRTRWQLTGHSWRKTLDSREVMSTADGGRELDNMNPNFDPDFSSFGGNDDD